jgi:crotonobetainyl-CoA:carnitine CoA-transferase CaiB-like acyl-CoA transferase
MSGDNSVDPAWRGPLADVKVIDLTRVLAGPFATQILSDLGAEVIKIETPGGGDDTRKIPPFVGTESHYFLGLNRGKKSVVLDLKKPEAVDLLRRLVTKVDVVIENFRPGVMDRLGLGYVTLSALNPRLIYCAISGFGLTGPLRDKPSFDIVTQALTGALSVNGERDRPPVKLGLPMGDMVGGIFGPIGILSALHERNATGRGRLIDISLYDGLIGMLGYLSQLSFVTGKDPAPVGSSHPNVVPYNSYAASDGNIIIAALSDAFWFKLCEAIERPDLAADSRLKTPLGRRENRDEVDGEVAKIIHAHPLAYWERRLSEFDIPHAPVLGVTAALAHPHALAREMVVTAQHRAVGEVRMTGRPIKFPGSTQTPLEPASSLGEQTFEVMERELGLGNEELERLRHAGAFGPIAQTVE